MQSPSLVLVGGPAAAGKSTTARLLSALLPAAHLDLDDLVCPAPHACRQGSGGTPCTDVRTTTARDYDALLAVAATILESGVSVVLDAPFTAELLDPTWCTRLTERAAVMGAELRVVLVSARAEDRRRRLEGRRATRDLTVLGQWDRLASATADTQLQALDVYNHGTIGELETRVRDIARLVVAVQRLVPPRPVPRPLVGSTAP